MQDYILPSAAILSFVAVLCVGAYKNTVDTSAAAEAIKEEMRQKRRDRVILGSGHC
jgi:hypothetical protein